MTSRTQKNPDDVVITLAIRTPLTKGFKGGLKDTPLDFIVYTLLKQVLDKSRIDPQLIEDVCLGNVGFGLQINLNFTDIIPGLQWKSRLHRPSRLPRSRVPHHSWCLLRKPLLLVRAQSCPRCRQSSNQRQYRYWCCNWR